MTFLFDTSEFRSKLRSTITCMYKISLKHKKVSNFTVILCQKAIISTAKYETSYNLKTGSFLDPISFSSYSSSSFSCNSEHCSGCSAMNGTKSIFKNSLLKASLLCLYVHTD